MTLTNADYEARTERMVRTEWFKQHVATFAELNAKVDSLDWRHPEHWNYRVRYLLEAGTLFVSGDLGSAVYRWGEAVTFEWLASNDLHYFAGKCEASEHGRQNKRWHPDVARARAWEHSPKLRYHRGTPIPFESADELRLFLMTNQIRLGLNYEQCGAILESGYVLNNRCIAHWAGIQMAVAQTKP